MSIPEPRPGLVIRYSFLWRRDAAKGAEEGAKDRPCAIVVAVKKAENGEITVIVAPISHTPPQDASAGIEMPDPVKRALRLDGDRQWLCFDELNRFVWPGYDLRPIPGAPGQYDYGMLPPLLYEALRKALLARQEAGRPVRPVNR